MTICQAKSGYFDANNGKPFEAMRQKDFLPILILLRTMIRNKNELNISKKY
jgi:hypothetical protein